MTFKNKEEKNKKMKIKAGQTCASCVMYADTKDYQWIVSRFEKKQGNGNYIVRDEFSETSEFDRYVVSSTNIIPFPLVGEKYQPGEHILALWFNEDTKTWSTMFYPATVVEVKPTHQLLIKYKSSQGAPNILIDYNKVSKYPEGFNLKSDEDSDVDDSKQSSNASQEQDYDSKGSDGSRKDGSDNRKISPQEEARIRFMTDQKPTQKEKLDFTPLTDEDFNELAGPRPPNNTITAVKGTPLLDFLQDELLFPQTAPHITGSGVLRRKNIEPKNPEKSALLRGPVQCGRINKILYEWK